MLDNLSTLVNGGTENDAESWISMQAWLLQLRRRGVTVLVVHHAGRGGNARGTSKREDVLDTVIQLKRPEDLTKARGVFGEGCLGVRGETRTGRRCSGPLGLHRSQERRCRGGAEGAGAVGSG
ncbi:hypothetical protein [Bradyrhizobium sp. S3.7.6]